MKRITILLMVLVSALTLEPASAETTRTYAYVGSPGPFTYVNTCQGGITPGVGVVCIRDLPGDFVQLSIADDTGIPIAARTMFVANHQWMYFASPRVCGASGRIPIPAEADMMHVFLAGPVEAAWWCLGHGDVGSAAVKGVVRATFST